MTEIYTSEDALTDEAEELLILLHSVEPVSLRELGSLFESNPFTRDDIQQATCLLSDQDIISSREDLKQQYFKSSRTGTLVKKLRHNDLVKRSSDGLVLDSDLRTLRFEQQSLTDF